jgi:DUF1009 family protein
MLDNKIGIIAGKGSLPRELISSANQRGVKPFLVALTDIADKETANNAEVLWAKIGHVGKIFKFFKDNNVRQVVFAGGLRRPSFTTLIPDGVGFKLLRQMIKLRDAGDNKLFDLIINFLEENGFSVLGVDQVVPELVASSGVIGKVEPSAKDQRDIEYGKHIAEEIGKLDIGQAVIVQNGVTLGVEGIDGTDALISRCSHLQDKGGGAILVKMKKPSQDRRIDLPVIGPATIERLYECKIKGAVIHAGSSLIIDREETIKLANKLGIFIYGV